MAEFFTLDAAAPLVTPRSLKELVPELRAGGVDGVLATVASVEGAGATLPRLARWIELERAGDLPFRLARTREALEGAERDGDIGIVLHFQGAAPLEGDAGLLTAYHELGVRVVQLTYNHGNLLGDGCFETRDAGLTALGGEAIGRMGELGMVVDVSHAGVRTSLEAVAAAESPVVATHSNARAVCDHPRNLTDEQIRAVAGSGGVVGMCAFPAFVSGIDPSLDGLVDHAEYIAGLAGPEHLGLGLDFADEDEDDYLKYGYDELYYPRPPWVYPEGIRGFADVGKLVDGLYERGFGEEEVTGILGGNFLRVFERVWGM